MSLETNKLNRLTT